MATGGNVLFLLAVYIIMAAVVMPSVLRDFKEVTNDADILDLRLYYSPEAALELVEQIGESGRKLYLFATLTADIAYPVIYTLLLCLLIAWLLEKIPNAARLERLIFLPFLVFSFDMLENSCISWLLHSFPDQSYTVATAAGIFTVLKWSAFALTLIAILYLAIRRLIPVPRHANSF